MGSPSSDSAAEPEVPEEETLDVNLGPKSHISLLDQHSELKRKAEGEHTVIFGYLQNGNKNQLSENLCICIAYLL